MPVDDKRPEEALRLGVSTCLLGEKVRFDGGHTRDRYVTDVLGQWVDYVPVCPEVEIGMSIPRPTIRLVNEGEKERLVAPSTGQDYTDLMKEFSVKKVHELQTHDLDGYILKRGSPSCGMERLSVYRNDTRMNRNGIGVFAEILMEQWPHLPVEEEGRLNDPRLRENFIERIFCRNRWRTLIRGGKTRGRLVQFHTHHKMLLLAHNQAAYRRLGKIVAMAGQISDLELYAQYEQEFQACLKHRSTPKRHANVLQHAMGYFKKLLTSIEKEEMNAAITDYRLGLIPLVVPVTLFRFNIQRFEIPYLSEQLYFNPHPKELMLRNHC